MAQVVLSPLVLVTPSVVGQVLLVDSSVIPLVVDSDLATTQINVAFEGSVQTITESTIVNGKRRFSGYFQFNTIGEVITLFLSGQETEERISPALTLNVQYVKFDNSVLLAAPPSGVSIHKGRTSCRVQWALPEASGFVGVRVLVSTDPAGISPVYSQIGGLVSRPTKTENSTINTLNQVQMSQDGDYRTTTILDRIYLYNFSSMDITPAMVGADEFYVMLSTVVQDPDTHHLYESSFAGPFKSGFVDLRRALPTDFPYLQRKEDIAGRMISEILKLYPDLDLTPRAELRDLLIDPLSLELAEMSVREWFARCSRSVSAMNAIDDSDGDGFSDPVGSNQLKQQIALAWHLSETEVQSLIDKQFDLLGEAAGVKRGGSSASVSQLTVYTYTRPSTRSEVTRGGSVATIPDSETPSVQFTITGSAVIDSSNVDSFYDAERGWWSVSVPVQCLINGTLGNVGTQTIRQVISGIPEGFSVTNLVPAEYGQDSQSNNHYAEVIQSRYITGIDSGSKLGLRTAALSVPGVLDARVVPSGDVDMLRDWDPINQKHTFGTVDIYVKGASVGQETSTLPVKYGVSSLPGVYPTHQSLLVLNKNYTALQISGYEHFPQTFIHPLEIVAVRGSRRLFFGVNKAQIDRFSGYVYLNPSELAFMLEGEGSTERRIPLVLNQSKTPATNKQLLAYLVSDPTSFVLLGSFRTLSPLSVTPTLQPVLSVGSLTGETDLSGVQSISLANLIKRQDPMLEGGSNRSTDEIRFDLDRYVVTTQTISFPIDGPKVVDLGRGLLLDVDFTGTPGALLSARSTDMVTLYTYGTDYTLECTGPYGQYALTIPAGSSFTGQDLLVSFRKLPVLERLLPVTETLTLQGTSWTPLKEGFVDNVWMPESYSDFSLADDGYNADPSLVSGLYSQAVPRNKRFIKVTYNNGSNDVTLREGLDFILSKTNNTYSVARVVSGSMPVGTPITVTYFRNEIFTITSSYPSFVQTTGTKISEIQNGGADILIKAMTENRVDVSLTVELDPSASQSVVDPKIRTALSQVMSQAKTRLSQSEAIRQIKAIPGVSNVIVPFSRFARADGSYDVGYVVPSGTSWTLAADEPVLSNINVPVRTYISSLPILPNRTIPSGGNYDSYVGFLYEGLSFERMFRIEDFESGKTPSFYIIGNGDKVGSSYIDSSYIGKVIISVPEYILDPTNHSFRATYQVFGEDGCGDIPVRSCEFLRPGKFSIDYILAKKSINLS